MTDLDVLQAAGVTTPPPPRSRVRCRAPQTPTLTSPSSAPTSRTSPQSRGSWTWGRSWSCSWWLSRYWRWPWSRSAARSHSPATAGRCQLSGRSPSPTRWRSCPTGTSYSLWGPSSWPRQQWTLSVNTPRRKLNDIQHNFTSSSSHFSLTSHWSH